LRYYLKNMWPRLTILRPAHAKEVLLF